MNKIYFIVLIIIIVQVITVATGTTTTTTTTTNTIIKPPSWWNDRIEEGNLLSISGGENEPESYLMTNVGNGYVSYVIDQDIFISGVFNGPALNIGTPNHLPSHRATIPNFQNISILNTQFQYSGLDIKNATYTRVYTLLNNSSPSPPNNNTIITQLYYAHQSIKNIIVQEIQIDNSNNIDDIEIEFNDPYFKNLNIDSNIDFNIENLTNSDYSGGDDGYQVYSLVIKVPEVSFMTSLAITTTSIPNNGLPINIKNGEIKKFIFLTSFLTNLETNDFIDGSIEIYKLNYQLPDRVLLSSHLNAWNNLWNSGIEVTSSIDGTDGDGLHLKQVINSSLYYLLSSIRDDWEYGISPGGLASNGYHGHSFWDTETFILPNFLLLYPNIAKSLLQYRVNHISGAYEKAKSYKLFNYTGFMFPWESAFTGEETCVLISPTGLFEQHISADIALAMKQYYYMTNDLEWLIDYGYKTVKGIAEFWESRVEFDELNNQYSINIIIPPDEYAIGVNNSVYTNVAVKMTFEWVIEISILLNDTNNIPLEKWKSIADGLIILFDEEKQYHPEYLGYSGEVIKQADVVLLGYPLLYNMSNQVRENDLIYYQSKTNPQGPAMTYGIHSILWLELGNLKNAEEQWLRSFNNCNNSPFLVWTETPTGGTTNFLTGIGGFLQTLLFGYGGIRIYSNSLLFYPQLPLTLSNIKIRSFYYLNSSFNIEWNSTLISFEMLSYNSSSSLSLINDNNNFILNLNNPIYLPFNSKFQIIQNK